MERRDAKGHDVTTAQDYQIDTDFLEELYDGAAGWLNLWRKGESQWYELPNLPTTCQPDQYFGVGVRQSKGTAVSRGKSADVSLVTCLWCDFDCDAPGKKKRHPSRELAEHLIGELPLKPSTIVWSGGGFHLYWLLHESATGAEAAGPLRAWNHWIAAKPLREYDLDSTFDLARVLRVPGSINTKYNGAKVLVVERNGLRYSLDDFEDYVTEQNESVRVSTEQAYQVKGDLKLQRDVNCPTEKLEALMENSPEFRRVWTHRKELPSASEYDLSLASHAVAALWNDQEIASLLIVHRRKFYPESVGKLLDRRDYVASTIAKARGNTAYDTSIRSLNGALDEREEPERMPAGAAPADTRQGIIDRLSVLFGVKIARWLQYGDEDAIYYLELIDGRRLRIGNTIAVLRSDAAMRTAIYEATRVCMKHIKEAVWVGVVESLSAIVEVEQQEESGHVEAVRVNIEQYLEQRTIYSEEGKALAVSKRAPFLEDGRIYLNMEDLRRWVGVMVRERVPRGHLLACLRLCGWSPTSVHIRPNPVVRYWCKNDDGRHSQGVEE